MEDDLEEEVRCRLLEFMFGNVDTSGDVDAGYLDDDARESLFALAGELEPSLADLGLEDSPLAGSKGLSGGFASGGDDEHGESPLLSPDQGDSASNFPADLPATRPLLFDEEDYDAEDDIAVEKSALENEIESCSLQRPFCGSFASPESLVDDARKASDVEIPLESPVSAGESSDSKEGIDLPVLCIEDGKEILRFSEIFGARRPSVKVQRRFPERKPTLQKGRRNPRLSNTVEDDEENSLKTGLCVPVMTRDFTPEIDDHVNKVGGNEDSCLPAQPMTEKPLIDESARWWEDSGTRFYPVDQLNWEDEIFWGSPTSSNHGSGSCVISEHEDVSETNEMADSRNPDQIFGMKPEEDPHLVSCADSQEPSVSMEDSGPTRLPSSGRMRTVQEEAKGKTYNGIEWLTQMLSLQNRELIDGTWLDQIVWDPADHIPKQKPAIPPRVFDHSGHQELSVDTVNLSNDEFYSNFMGELQPRIRPMRRSDYIAKVVHSVPALKLQTMKPRLSIREVANFHRPRSIWYPTENKYASKLEGDTCTQGPIKIILKSLGGKHIKLKADAGESLFFIKSKISKKLDIKFTEKIRIFYRGKELNDFKSLGHQGIKPNSLLHIMRSKIHLWPFKRHPCVPRAFRTKSDLSLKDGHAILIEYIEERPLLLGNTGMGARICAYYRHPNHEDQASLPPTNGIDVMPLDAADESPFLFGNIDPGCSQLSLETNMYRVLLSPQQLSSIDYLLVRSAKGRLSLRRISKIYSAGRQEPLKEVNSPARSSIRSYNSKRLLVYVYRQFCSREHPWICPNELSYQFPSISESLIRKRLKHCAELVRRSNGVCFWMKKPDFKVPSEGEIRRILSPEDVCSFESMQAGVHALKLQGIKVFHRPINISSVSHPIDLEVASYIERKLLMTPWNLSSRFLRNRKFEICNLCLVMRHPHQCHGKCQETCIKDDTDLDSFAVDLENLLVAGDGEQRGAENEEDDVSEATLMSTLLHDDDDDNDDDISIHGRLIFACRACGKMGHMKTNKSCPMYNNKPGTTESENTSARKLMRLETSRPGKRESLRLKFKFSPSNLDCKQVEEIGVRTVPSLMLRLPASRKIILKLPLNAENSSNFGKRSPLGDRILSSPEMDFTARKRSKICL